MESNPEASRPPATHGQSAAIPLFRPGSFESRKTPLPRTMQHEHLRLSPNGRGATAYLPRDLLDDTTCPLAQGTRCRAELHGGIGILLVASSDTTDYTIHHR